MKLFQISYMQDDDEGSYLTVAKDEDTEESIKKRELTKRDWECLYFLSALEITEVDGYPVTVSDARTS